jgi:Uma2 family endonuclease
MRQACERFKTASGKTPDTSLIYNETVSAITKLTAEEFLNLPDTPGKQELLDGELISLPLAKHSHSEIARKFERLLRPAIDESRVWRLAAYQLRRGWLIRMSA